MSERNSGGRQRRPVESETEVAYRTVLVHQQYTATSELDIETAIQNLVADLRRLAEEYGCDWPTIIEQKENA